MQKLVFKNANGVEIDLTSSPYGITEWEGLAGADLNIQTQQVPFEDGAVFLDALIDQREIAVTLAIKDDNNLATRYALRRELISVLNPKLGEGVLVYTNDFISKQIHCIPQIPIFENHNSNDAGTPKASLVFSCPSPYWEDLEDTVIEFGVGEGIAIENEGDVETPIKLELFGNINKPTVINETTNKKIAYDGNVESYLSINTGFGKKEVLAGDESISFYSVIPRTSWLTYSKKIGKFILSGLYTTKDGERYDKIKLKFDYDTISYIKEINNKYFITFYKNNTWGIAVCESLNAEASEYLISTTSSKILDYAYSEENGKYIAVGQGGVILTSTTCETWEAQTSGTSENLNAVIDSKVANKVICVGNNKVIVTSSDCITWQTQTTPATSSQNLTSVAEGNGVIITNKFKSFNGTNWQLLNNSIMDIGSGSITFATYLGLFILAGGRYITRTGDNITRTEYNFGTDGVCAVDEEDNLILCAINYSPDIIYGMFSSYDAVKWEQVSPLDVKAIISKDGIFYGCYRNIYEEEYWFVKSEDMIQWEKVTVLDIPYLNADTYKTSIKILNDKMVIYWYYRTLQVRQSGFLYSSDETNWTSSAIIQDVFVEDVIYSELIEKYIAVGSNSQNKAVITKSEDLTTWETTQYTSYTKFSSIDATSNIICITDEQDLQNKILVSYDGISITELSLPTFTYNYACSKVYYSKIFNKLYLFGRFRESGQTYDTGILLFSSDGVQWNIINYELEYQFTIGESVLGNKILIMTSNYYTSEGKTIIGYDGINFNNIEMPEEYLPLGPAIMVNNGDKFIFGNDIMGSNERYIMGSGNLVNGIANLSKDSDMNFNLAEGINNIRITKASGSYTAKLTYRQKYIGV